MSRKKGSLSVEAVISMTVFIGVMFLMLTLVKLVLVMTILNNATTEAAKTIASSGYIIGVLNEKQADVEKSVENIDPTNLADSAKGLGESTVVTELLGGSGKNTLVGGGKSALLGILKGAAIELEGDKVYKIKGKAASAIVGNIVKGYIEDCGIPLDESKLMLRAVKIPETDREFKTLHAGNMPLSETGTLEAAPKTDFNKDDVLICLEYPCTIALPLIPSVTVTLRSTAVERAWLHGTGSGPARREGVDLTGMLDKYVYIGAKHKGTKYHQENCMTLWRGSEKIKLSDAKGKYEPCAVCNP